MCWLESSLPISWLPDPQAPSILDALCCSLSLPAHRNVLHDRSPCAHYLSPLQTAGGQFWKTARMRGLRCRSASCRIPFSSIFTLVTQCLCSSAFFKRVWYFLPALSSAMNLGSWRNNWECSDFIAALSRLSARSKPAIGLIREKGKFQREQTLMYHFPASHILVGTKNLSIGFHVHTLDMRGPEGTQFWVTDSSCRSWEAQLAGFSLVHGSRLCSLPCSSLSIASFTCSCNYALILNGQLAHKLSDGFILKPCSLLTLLYLKRNWWPLLNHLGISLSSEQRLIGPATNPKSCPFPTESLAVIA